MFSCAYKTFATIPFHSNPKNQKANKYLHSRFTEFIWLSFNVIPLSHRMSNACTPSPTVFVAKKKNNAELNVPCSNFLLYFFYYQFYSETPIQYYLYESHLYKRYNSMCCKQNGNNMKVNNTAFIY